MCVCVSLYSLLEVVVKFLSHLGVRAGESCPAHHQRVPQLNQLRYTVAVELNARGNNEQSHAKCTTEHVERE